MPLVLAIEPDLRQAAIIKRVIKQQVHADLVLVDSRDAAIAALSSRLPDVVLLTALMSPRDEEELIAHLRSLDGAEHLQTHTIPQLASGGDADARADGAGGGLLGRFRRKKETEPIPGCDPALFAQEVSAFLQRAAELKAEAAAHGTRVEEPERPGAPAAAAGVIDLPDVMDSSSAWSSPFEWRRSDPPRHSESGEEETAAPREAREPLVTAQPLAVIAEEEDRRRVEEERARLLAEAAENERLRREAEAEIERLRVEAEAEAERLRAEAEADARARAQEEAERLRAELEAQAAAERDRLRLEAEAAAERERLRLEAEAAAERERLRREAEAAAAAERERLRREAEAAAAAERERLRREAEAAAAAERERLRREAEAAAAAERERLRREAEAAAAAERERLRREAEAAAAERERLRLEAEAAAAERERLRLEAEAAAERERLRLEAEAAAERERERLRLEAEALAAEIARAAEERERLRVEAEALAARSAAGDAGRGEVVIDLDGEASFDDLEPEDAFAEFREDADQERGVFRLMPLAAWTRREEYAPLRKYDGRGATPDDDPVAHLALPPHVAAVTYPRGCRIRRVRVPAQSGAARARTPHPVILSRRTLEEMRTSR